MIAARYLAGTFVSNATHTSKGGDFTMRTILAAMFAVVIGLSFVGSTFADDKKMDAPAGAPADVKKDESKKTETKSETKTENKNGKKSKKHKKSTKTEESATEKH